VKEYGGVDAQRGSVGWMGGDRTQAEHRLTPLNLKSASKKNFRGLSETRRMGTGSETGLSVGVGKRGSVVQEIWQWEACKVKQSEDGYKNNGTMFVG